MEFFKFFWSLPFPNYMILFDFHAILADPKLSAHVRDVTHT